MIQITFLEPEQVGASRFKPGYVHYMGKRHRVALLTIGGQQVQLGLADTGRCAVDLDVAKSTVRGLAARFELPAVGVDSAAVQLQQHCRALTGWKPRVPRR